MKTTIAEAAGISGSRIVNAGGTDLNKEISTLLTDSRSLINPEGTLFFAIPTATNDGIRYMRDLYDKGVRMFLAEEIPENMADAGECIFLINPDPVKALQKIAARTGNEGGEVVAITGSRGKTTLKEWIFQLLEPLREIARSPRSYNSQIGVPLSLWEISPTTDLALIEAGISQVGEMEALAECIHPDVVILTDIGEEHSEGFANLQEKVAEKLKLAANPYTARIIYCSDFAIVDDAVRLLPESLSRIYWSDSDTSAPLYISEISDTDSGLKKICYRWYGEPGSVECNLHSIPELRNACYALAFMLSEGYEERIIAARFARLHPIETRLSVSDGGNGCSIIYDSYTSDISSLLPAMDFMMRRKVPGQKSTLILSDLRHEGHGDTDDYKRIADLISLKGIDRFIGVGKRISEHKALYDRDSLFFDNTQDLLSYLRENPLKDSIILVKGSPDFDFSLIKEVLEVRTHETVLEVNLDAIIRNYNYFKSHLPASTGMVAMVKASGYGAGSYEIAKTLQDAGAAYLAVAVLDEGLDLRRRGITMPVMVMNPRVADYREMFLNNLEPEIYTAQMLNDVIYQAERYGVKDYPIHVKLDTGMHRMGFIESELPALMERILSQDNVRISSVFSHLATADEPTMDDYTQYQLDNFERFSTYMLSRSPYHFKRHILNSAGILRFGEKYHYDMARLGIGLYGVNTLPPEMESPLSCVSSLKTVIINLREWPEGATVGYGRRGVLMRKSKIATIPIGYADGMSRAFGNGAVKVLVNGHLAPTIGNICMDACMIDVTDIECKEGDQVEIFGENIGVQRLADVLSTIPYEILTSVSPRVKRIYFRE